MNNTEYPKVEKELFNVNNENLQKLASLFPSAVKDGQLDIEALKEELGQFEEVSQEKYELNWAGKQNAKKEARKNILGKTLRYIEGDGVNEDTTQNLYIEGDNLEVLKLLRKNYYGSIKMIYIDPPYNTGNDFVYNDNFSMSQEELEQMQGERDEYGERLQKNSKDSAKYHTNWLNMMYPRLQLAKDLLTDDGVIFISIDDNEQANLKQLCDSIFGSENFIATLPTIMNLKGNNDEFGFAGTHEYTYVYAKNVSTIEELNGIALTNEDIKEYSETDEIGKYKKGATLMRTGEAGAREKRPKGYYPIYVSIDLKRMSLEKVNDNDYIVYPKTVNGKEMSWRRSPETLRNSLNEFIITKNGDNISFYKKQRLEDDLKTGKKPKSLFYKPEYSSGNGTQIVVDLLKGRFFNNPKPLALMSDFIRIGMNNADIVLDFFSGSATTAHAVMQLNAEDGGRRKYICVQLPEQTEEKSEAYKFLNELNKPNTICELGKERIRRAGQKIKEEIEQNNVQLKLGEEQKQLPDIGFKVFRVGETTLNWEKLRLQGKDMYHDYIAGTSEKDKLDFTPTFENDLNVVYEIMLRQEGLPLTSTIEKLTDIGTRTYLVADSYLISLEENVTPEMIEKLSALNPLPIKFVFRDSAFDDDIAFKDETFRKLNALIDKNTSDEKKTYTVEFI